MFRLFMTVALLLAAQPVFCWGFFGHRRINEYAIYLLPPEMLVFYKPRLAYIRDHAVDPDKRRYILKAEAPRHYIDLDQYGPYPFSSLPRNWDSAVARYGEDSLLAHGIVPWRILQVVGTLTKAFRQRDGKAILKTSTDLGHYIADAHVPLHTSSNHNGQHTGQHGIHGFWESRLPELLADAEWDFLLGRAAYIDNMEERVWQTVLESAAAVDSVLQIEQQLTNSLPPDAKYAFEWRNQQVVKQYAAGFSRRYNKLLRGMVERRMQQSIVMVAGTWYTAWVNAGQPDLRGLDPGLPPVDSLLLDSLLLQQRKIITNAKTCD
ncbi:MAG: zinc dependent phospholipase C family protein [Flavihumibacter sp.]